MMGEEKKDAAPHSTFPPPPLLPLLLPLLRPLLLLLLPLLSGPCRAAEPQVPLTVQDLQHLGELFSGEWDNKAQYRQEQFRSRGEDFHFCLRRVHVPVEVPALQEGAGVAAVSRQFYLEQFFGDVPVPARQRIFNIVLRSESI